MSEVLNRNLKLLQLIPRHPRKKSPQLLKEELLAAGFDIAERSIQRNLIDLSEKNGFPITSDTRNKPYGWSWMKDAPNYDLPSMDKNTALSFYLSEQFLHKIIPPSVTHHLEPNFKQAKAVLDDKNQNNLIKWREKVRVLSRTQPLQSPIIDNNTLEVAYQALLEGKQFSVIYKPRLQKPKEYIVNPLGIVVRDQLIYLVAMLWDYSDPIQLLLNRMDEAKILDNPITATSFDLDNYIAEGHFEYLESDNKLSIQLSISQYSSVAFDETPLSNDQTLESIEDNRYLVTATVKDTQQLRWWLMGFGDGIEVLKPHSLRTEMINMAKSMLEIYKGQK